MEEQYFDNKMIEEMQASRKKPQPKGKMPRWFYWVVWITFFLAVAATAVGIIQGAKVKNDVVRLEKKTNAFNKEALRDSTAVMGEADIKYLVAESTQRYFDTYISTQDNMITLLGIIISALVAIIGIAVPVIVNNSMKDSNETWFQKKTEEGIQTVHEETKEIISKGITNLKTESSKSALEVKKQLEAQLKEVQDKITKLEKGAVDKISEVKHEESLAQVDTKDSTDDKIKYLESEIEKNRQNYPATGFYELGKLLFEIGKYPEAKNRLDIAIERNPEFVSAYQLLAEIYLREKNPNKAWKQIEKALAIKDSCTLLEIRSRIFKEKGLCEAALKDAQRGIDLARVAGETKCLDRLSELKEIVLQEQNEKAQNEDEETFSVNGVKFQMKKVSGGAFTIGAADGDQEAYPEEKPAHRVLLDDYYIGETVVTQKLWKAVMGNNPSYFKGEDNPVECVSWNDSQEFIQKLNALTGRTFRLPTEAEWEFSARGGNKSKGFKYSGSNDINEVAWYWQNSGDKILKGTDDDRDFAQIKKNNSKTHPVGQKKPNELGLYDMSGNVREWCNDWLAIYSADSQTNPEGPKEGGGRVVRGGDCIGRAKECRVSDRFGFNPSDCYPNLGFRLALDPESTTER